jgi:hypothetical protein
MNYTTSASPCLQAIRLIKTPKFLSVEQGENFDKTQGEKKKKEGEGGIRRWALVRYPRSKGSCCCGYLLTKLLVPRPAWCAPFRSLMDSAPSPQRYRLTWNRRSCAQLVNLASESIRSYCQYTSVLSPNLLCQRQNVSLPDCCYATAAA